MNKFSIQIFAVVLFVIVAVAALYLGGVFGNSESGSANFQGERVAQKVHILNYSDYSCPACKAYIPMQEMIKEEFGDMVEIEYRHFPLSGFAHSRLASHVVEAARNQGKYTEMHNLLYEYQSEWAPQQADAMGYFTDFAERLELDMDQFLADLESDEVRERVENQRQEGIRRTVTATPTFFIDGHKLRQNPQSFEQFKSIVELYMYRSN